MPTTRRRTEALPARWIEHVTLTTGHTRRSPREEVSDDAVTVMRAVIDRLRADPDGTQPIPGCPGYSLGGRGDGKCLVATVWADGPPSVVICSIGVAAHARCGMPLWRMLHRYGALPVVTDHERQPATPWCAAALEVGIARHMEAAAWLGDFERCLAWAWIAILEDRR